MKIFKNIIKIFSKISVRVAYFQHTINIVLKNTIFYFYTIKKVQ